MCSLPKAYKSASGRAIDCWEVADYADFGGEYDAYQAGSEDIEDRDGVWEDRFPYVYYVWARTAKQANPHPNVNPVVWEPWKDFRIVKHPLLYICSPYTPRGDDPCPESHQNVKKAIDAGIAALHKGWVPVIPHLYHHVHLEHPHPYETWMTVGSSLLERCDALLVVDPSDLTPGMKREIDQAAKQGTRILWGLGSL